MATKLAKKGKKLEPVINDEGVSSSVEVVKRKRNGKKEILSSKGEVTEDTASTPVAPIKPGQVQVGMSKGYTINLENFESAKISCWVTRMCNDTEVDIADTMAEISSILDEQLEIETAELVEE